MPNAIEVHKPTHLMMAIIAVVGVTSSVVGNFIVHDPAYVHRYAMMGDAEMTWLPGFWIGMGRLAIGVLGLAAIEMGFPKSLRELFRVWDPSTWNLKTWTPWFRLVFLTIAIGWGGYETARSFDETADGPPAKMVTWGIEHDSYNQVAADPTDYLTLDSKVNSSQRSYAAFAVYHAILFALIVPVLGVVPAFSLVREDWRYLKRSRNRLEEREGDALQRFKTFHDEILDHSKRYMRLLALVGLSAAFEQYIAYWATPVEDRVAVNIGLGVVGLVGVALLVLGCYYYQGWQIARRDSVTNDATLKELAESYTPKQFIRTLLKFDFNGVIVMALLVAPWKDRLPFISNLFG